jgi:hypothetical protein
MSHLGVSDVAAALKREGLDVGPREITDAFYRRILDTELCPVVGGRRIIPESYVRVIADTFRRAGRIAHAQRV